MKTTDASLYTLASLATLCALTFAPTPAHADYDFDAIEANHQAVYAATPIDLQGRVVDEMGFAIADANLTLVGWGDSIANDGEAGLSAGAGDFEIVALARRSVLLLVEAEGYYTEVLPVDLQRPLDEIAVDLGDISLRAQQFGRARLTFGGDAMFGRRMIDADEDGVLGESGDLLHPGSLGPDTAALFDFITPVLVADDHTAINLETPVTDDLSTPHPTKSYVFQAYPESAAELPGVGVDSVSLGNNHIYDYLEIGVSDSLVHLDAIGLPWYGAGMSEAQARTNFIEVSQSGVELSLQGFSDFVGFSYGGDANKVIAMDAPLKGGALRATSTNLSEFILAGVAADRFTVPIIHGGTEYSPLASSGMDADFEHAVAEGASLVVAHHPHVVHGVTVIDAGEGPRYVLGSLGNLVFDQDVFETYRSYLAVVDVEDGQAGPQVTDLSLIPFRLDGYVPRLLAGSALEAMGRHVAHLSSAEAEAKGRDSAVVYAEGGRLRVATSENEVLVSDLADQRLVGLDAGSTGALTLDPYAGNDALASLASQTPATCTPGRDLFVVGDFEDHDVDDTYLEGDLWDQSSTRYVQGAETHAGVGAAVLLRSSTNSSRTSIWMGNRIEIDEDDALTITGYSKAENAGDFRMDVRWMNSAGSTISYTYITRDDVDWDWERFSHDLTPPAGTTDVKIYFRHYPPDSGGEGRLFLDDVALVQWGEAVAVDQAGVELATPNDWGYVQCTAAGNDLDLTLGHRVYESPGS